MFYNIWIVARRELGALFSQPIAYIFAIVMLFFGGSFYWFQTTSSITFQGSAPSDMNIVFSIMTFITLLLAPAITMRLLAEEQRAGTLELLMTMPVRDGEVVLGKYLAALITFLFPVLLSVIFVFFLFRYGNPDVGVLFASYIGMILWGAGFLAIGTLASAFTENQISAFLIGFFIALVLYLAEIPSQIGAFGETVNTISRELSYQSHFNNFQRGLITVKDVLYYVLISAVALFAATRVVESRRWR